MKTKNFPELHQKNLNKALWLVQRVPFTRVVMLTGSFAEERGTEKSDIDFFVQVSSKHLWTGRFITTAILQLAGIRRTDTQITGRICLNWFATFNAPAEQPGRKFKVLWQQRRPGHLKSICELLLSGYMGKVIENFLESKQKRRIEQDPRTHMAGSQVRYNNSELGFHPPK